MKRFLRQNFLYLRYHPSLIVAFLITVLALEVGQSPSVVSWIGDIVTVIGSIIALVWSIRDALRDQRDIREDMHRAVLEEKLKDAGLIHP